MQCREDERVYQKEAVAKRIFESIHAARGSGEAKCPDSLGTPFDRQA